MSAFEDSTTKYAVTSRNVPLAEMARLTEMRHVPRVGDLVMAEILEIGKNTKIEVRRGVMMDLFPGDHIVGSFGNRYATDQFEGYVPGFPVEECDLLSVGGVCGEAASWHEEIEEPTRLRVRGMVCDRDGEILNQRDFGLREPSDGLHPLSSAETILVVGSSMNSGKTNTAGSISRSLTRKGFRVAAAKVTGTAAGKDVRHFESCGADPVLDFVSAGYPSTYMLDRDELLGIYRALLAHLRGANPDYIVLEIADGIFQRETRMMLESEDIRDSVDHVFFAAGDSLSIEAGVRSLGDLGLPLRATSGALTQSLLAVREAEEATGIPCPGTERIMGGELMKLLEGEIEPDEWRPDPAPSPIQVLPGA